MDNKAAKLLKKISSLPEEAQMYFGADEKVNKLLLKFLQKLCQEHNLSGKENYFLGLIDEHILNDFNFRGIEEKIAIDLKFPPSKAKQLFVDYLGMIFLPIDKYLDKVKIDKEIERRGGNVEEYQKYIDEFEDTLEDEVINALEELSKKFGDLVDANEEEATVLELLSNHLVEILRYSFEAALTNLNGGLIYLLFNKKGFKEKALQTLLNNQEKLTHKTFILDGQPARPTVANWLKDFIKQNGTGMFSNLVLSKYLTNSPNAKELSFEERRLVGKLLNTYRNLKFFPESMKNLPPEEWQIIPVTTTPQPTKARTLVGPKVKPEDVIAEFDKLAQQYPAGSLERKAIEEEKKRYVEKYEEVKRNS